MGAINIVDEVKILGEDGSSEAIVDQYNKALAIIATEHQKIHQGKGYTLSLDFIVDTNSYQDILLVNPALSFPHFRYYATETTGAPCEICFLREPTASDNGVLQSPKNNNFNSANTSDLQIYSSPVITDIGAEQDCDYITGGKFEGGSVSPAITEWILAPSEKYLLRFENKSGTPVDLNVHLFYYE